MLKKPNEGFLDLLDFCYGDINVLIYMIYVFSKEPS